jgi:hypothetical protein
MEKLFLIWISDQQAKRDSTLIWQKAMGIFNILKASLYWYLPEKSV